MHTPHPAAPPASARPGLRSEWPSAPVAGVLLLAVLIAAVTNYLFVLNPDAVTLDISVSWADAGLLATVAALLLVAVRRPGVAYAAVVAIIYLNLSEVLVRFHGLPSLLQLLALPLLVVGLLEIRRPQSQHRLWQPLTFWLVVYVLVVLTSTTYATDASLADEALLDRVKALTIYAWVAVAATSLRHVSRAVGALVAAAALLALLGLAQTITSNFAFEFGGLARVKDAQIYGDVFEPRLAGPLGDPNYFGQILLIAVPYGLLAVRHVTSGWRKAALLVGVAIIVAGAVLTYSRGTALAGVLMMTALVPAFGVNVRKGLVAFVGALIVAMAILPSDVTRRLATLEQLIPGSADIVEPDSSFEKRKLMTAVAWAMFWDHPLPGLGAGNYAAHFADYADYTESASRVYRAPRVDDDDRPYPHSLYLEIAAETGLAGLLAFGSAIAAAGLLLWRARRRFLAAGESTGADLAAGTLVAIGGYLVCALFLHGHFQRYLWLLLAFAAALHGLSFASRADAPRTDDAASATAPGARP